MSNAPIIAVSSPPGRSHRGLIRITGPDLAPLIDAVLNPSPTPRTLTTCTLKAQGLPSSLKAPGLPSRGLPVLALYHRGPHSFTTHDVLEIQCPGNPALLDRLLHRLLDAMRQTLGVGRIAEPGEFTQRAFLAGRIDLTRAEGIAATISATADAQLAAARLLRTGRLGQWAVELVDRFAQALALVEAGIDFVDQDDVTPIAPRALDGRLDDARRTIESLLKRSRSWSAIEALPWVVLVGPPNAGKSTLFNALLGRTRAVVSDVAGTTRDVLTEPLRIGDGEVMLVDIAGLDRPEQMLDHAMQAAARDAIDRAELIVLLDPEMPPPREDVAVVRVRPKADLPGPRRGPAVEAVEVSGVTGQGLDELRARIAAALRDRAVSLAGEMLALQPRHEAQLRAALGAVHSARQMLAGQIDSPQLQEMELIAGVMREALDHLAALGGQMTPDDVIGKIFATFCIGK